MNSNIDKELKLAQLSLLEQDIREYKILLYRSIEGIVGILSDEQVEYAVSSQYFLGMNFKPVRYRSLAEINSQK